MNKTGKILAILIPIVALISIVGATTMTDANNTTLNETNKTTLANSTGESQDTKNATSESGSTSEATPQSQEATSNTQESTSQSQPTEQSKQMMYQEPEKLPSSVVYRHDPDHPIIAPG
ncbi:hypothetical protein [Methanobacterium formicicum]|mgnify:FL=1|uniref:hypothetical protein n=1 Tax=Methanobacterium formicicum TaxID=2162 RepID=UPI002490CDF7|nr:hypothetical protein [Methanobacterium formicicum]